MRGATNEKIILLILGLMLMVLPGNVLAAQHYTPIYYPDLETAFRVPAWKTWPSPTTNDYAAALTVPSSWNSPTTTNYTEYLTVPAWKTWNSPTTTNYTASLTVPAWKSWKPLSYSSWDMVFRIP